VKNYFHFSKSYDHLLINANAFTPAGIYASIFFYRLIIISMQLSLYFRSTLAMRLVALSFLFSSCYTYKVATHAQEGSEYEKPVTVHAFFWGLAQKPANGVRTPLCDSLGVNGMSEVKVKTNLGYALVTVATLGIWCPMKLQWKCGKPCKKPEEHL
jgi:hypothetical protein